MTWETDVVDCNKLTQWRERLMLWIVITYLTQWRERLLWIVTFLLLSWWAGITYSWEGPQGLFHEEIDCLLSLTADLSGQRTSDILCNPGVSLSRQGISLFPSRGQISIYEYLSIPVLLIFSRSFFVQGNYLMCVLCGCDRNWKYFKTLFFLIVNTLIRIKCDRRKSLRNSISNLGDLNP